MTCRYGKHKDEVIHTARLINSALTVDAGAKRGVLGLPGIEEDVGMIGLHWGHRFLELVPWAGIVNWEVGLWAILILLVHAWLWCADVLQLLQWSLCQNLHIHYCPTCIA